jgi:hypothetical protein
VILYDKNCIDCINMLTTRKYRHQSNDPNINSIHTIIHPEVDLIRLINTNVFSSQGPIEPHIFRTSRKFAFNTAQIELINQSITLLADC